MRRKMSKKKIALIFVNIVLSLVFAVLLGGTAYVEYVLGRFHQDPSQEATLSSAQKEAILNSEPEGTKPPDATVVDPDELEWEAPDKLETQDHIFNLLLVGQDRRPGEIRARSDTMLMITVNTRDNTVTMTSFLRDLYVQIPGYYYNRLNVPYALEGSSLLFDTMELNLGIRPDRFVEVDFDGFQTIVDIVGGVDIYVTAAEASYLNYHNGWGIREGVNHLDGEKALAYARNRSTGGNGDFGRTQRQRNVIEALIEKASTLDLVTLNELILAVSDVVNTDMTSAEMLSYALRFYPVLSKLDQVQSVQIPAEGTYYLGWADGIGSVVVADLKANSKVVAQTQD